MTSSVILLGSALLLFYIGMYLSAFFSGSETGFYRVSSLQLTLRSQHGDTTSRQILEFLEHPTRFVSTTLVGNNVANYLTTVAISLLLAALSSRAQSSAAAEVAATLIMTPVIFVFGELIPKSLYYRAPLTLLHRGHRLFRFFYLLFLPLTFPMTLIAGGLSKITRQDRPSVDTMFSRTRLFGLIASGQRDGILTRIQRRLADNLMTSGSRILADYREPISVFPGMPLSCTRDQLLATADAHQAGWVLLHTEGTPREWTAAVRVAAVVLSSATPVAAAEPLPHFREEDPPLKVLGELFQQNAHLGIVTDGDTGHPLGIIRRDQLADRLLVSPGVSLPPHTAWEL